MSTDEKWQEKDDWIDEKEAQREAEDERFRRDNGGPKKIRLGGNNRKKVKRKKRTKKH